ncbi:hypothetical protein OA069_01360 [Paracoccaceae bacterium]|nr:hypothetical protein [Paracoccaceae bacterium]|tara:strand:- start:143 stop:361 length:219 start_codon:yes stop_codon:yes gene_type:complete
MGQKIKLADEEYEVEDLSDQAKVTLAYLQFSTTKMQELVNMKALLQRAQNSYAESLKREVLSSKGGFNFSED